MAGEKEEKKKPGIVRRIFKWIGLGLLTVLIILGLIFQAPWKVTTLLVIILLACTILPKQLRKWFWAGVGAVVIALIVWVFLPQETEGWRPYKFDKELATLEAKRAIPDEENAAIIYNQLLDSYDSNSFYSDLPENERKKIPMREPWLSRDHPEIAEWLEKHQATISMLLNASRIEKCRFAINADFVSLGDTMNRLPPMRQWAYLLISAANNDIAKGRTEEGFQKYIALLQMSKHLRQQPTNLDLLVGIAIEALALGQFNRFAVTDDATEENLSIIEKALEEIKHDWSLDLSKILECEKLMMKNFLGVFYAVNPEGKVRLTRGLALTTTIIAQLPEDMKDELVITYWHKRLMKLWTILSWLYMPSSPQKAAKIINASFERLYAMAEPHFDWQKEPRRFSLTSAKFNYHGMVDMLLYIMEPAYHRIHDQYLRVMAGQGGSRLIIALRRYKNQNGFWPVNLNDVKSMAPAEIFVDPTNGGDFVYEITEENFRLYSKGKNGIDEDGRYKRKYGEISEGDDWPIWPPRSRKAKEENTDDEQQ